MIMIIHIPGIFMKSDIGTTLYKLYSIPEKIEVKYSLDVDRILPRYYLASKRLTFYIKFVDGSSDYVTVPGIDKFTAIRIINRIYLDGLFDMEEINLEHSYIVDSIPFSSDPFSYTVFPYDDYEKSNDELLVEIMFSE